VRDVLFVDDLLDAYDIAVANRDRIGGQIYNLGGGPANQLAVWQEFGPMLARLLGHSVSVGRGDWRPGDQRIFVADIRKAAGELGWRPKVNVETGIARLYAWVHDNLDLVRTYR